MLTTTHVASITGRPERIHIRVVIGVRVRSLWATVIRLLQASALAPVERLSDARQAVLHFWLALDSHEGIQHVDQTHLGHARA